MPRVTPSTIVPYSPEQMFVIVNDVTQYSNFVPDCKRGVLVRRHGAWELKKLEFNLPTRIREIPVIGGLIDQAFPGYGLATWNNPIPYSRIEMHLDNENRYFQSLEGVWQFDVVTKGTRVSLDLTFEFQSSIFPLDSLKEKAEQVVTDQMSLMIEAFVLRANDLYRRSPSPELI